MPANITDSNAFTSPIVAPVDGDAATAASVLAAIQGLANRTAYLDTVLSKFTTVAALGSSNADAAPLTRPNAILTSGGAGRGVILTAAQRDYCGFLFNASAQTIKLYPIVGETLQGLNNPGVTDPWVTAADEYPYDLTSYGLYFWFSTIATVVSTPAVKWAVRKIS